MAMLLCLAIVFSFIENMIPPLPALPPGVKLGLSNIVTIYCIFFLDHKSAFGISALKSVFVLLTRGVTAGVLSFFGGILSVLMMSLFKKENPRYLILSIIGAVSHNIGQLLVSALLFKTASIFYYLPVLVISVVVMVSVTATLMKVLIPALKRISN